MYFPSTEKEKISVGAERQRRYRAMKLWRAHPTEENFWGVESPKALGDIRGVTYIYGMFYRFGLIDVPDEVKKMGHPKDRKK